MSILALLNRVVDRVNQPPHPCLDRESVIRRSYLTGIAMQALSDGHLSRGEQTLFLDLARAFGLVEEEAHEILEIAAQPSEETVMEIRTHLLNSRFKYYFVLDLQIMAHQDQRLCEVEQSVLSRFCDILEIENEDMFFLVGLADAVMEKDPGAKQQWADRFFKKNKYQGEIGPGDFAHYTEGSPK